MIPFVKAHACGNDFLVIEEADALGRHAELARHLCARTTGVGADGIEFLERSSGGALRLRLFNADGSEAELSGNGTRCVAAWLAVDEGLREARFETAGGVRVCRTLSVDGEQVMVETDMGVPQVHERSVLVENVGEVAGAEVNVGNPHFVIFTEAEDFATNGMSWQELGALICTHRDFPAGTNVEFVRVISEAKIEFRIYERGVGPTHSSGTGTCASSAAAIALRGCRAELAASSIGGEQRVVWASRESEMRLTGPAAVICVGKASIQA